jgi:hypothetical protein
MSKAGGRERFVIQGWIANTHIILYPTAPKEGMSLPHPTMNAQQQ